MHSPYAPEAYTITDAFRESSDTVTLTVDLASDHEPGQFFQVSVPGYGESPISICSDSREHVKFNIREVGNVTRKLAKLGKGDRIWIRGPYGHGYPMRQLVGNNLVIIGGGCGVAPLKGLIDYVENHRDEYAAVRLFLGYRSPDDIIFKREIEEWEQRYHLTVTVDKNPAESCYVGTTGFVTDALSQAELSNENTVVFLCGPPVMMKGAIAILSEKGFHDDQIFLSAERLMYCAVGACCHCMIRGAYTCIDGPVFRYDDLKHATTD